MKPYLFSWSRRPISHRPSPSHAFAPLALGLALSLCAPWSRAQQPLTTISGAIQTAASEAEPGNVDLTKPNPIGAVSGGSSGKLGGAEISVYGDTYVINPHSQDQGDDTAYIIPSTYDLRSPPVLTWQGLPYQLIRYTQAEWDYNSASKNRNDRYALWPTAVLTTDASHVRILYTKAHVTKNAGISGPNQYDTAGTGFAQMAEHDLQAKRDFRRDQSSGLTFSGATRPFGRSGATQVTANGVATVYLFDCTNDDGDNCYLARISAASDADDKVWGDLLVDPANFQTWTGNQWSADLSQAKPVQHLHASAYGWTMAWNDYATNPETGKQGAYIGFYNDTGYRRNKLISNGDIKFVVAARPEGPWSDPVQAYHLDPNLGRGDDYANYDVMQFHDVRLHWNGKQTVYLTVAVPNPQGKYGLWRENIEGYEFTLQNVSSTATAAEASQ